MKLVRVRTRGWTGGGGEREPRVRARAREAGRGRSRVLTIGERRETELALHRAKVEGRRVDLVDVLGMKDAAGVVEGRSAVRRVLDWLAARRRRLYERVDYDA